MKQLTVKKLKLKPWNLKTVSCFTLLFHFLRNVSDYGLEVNICTSVVLVELSDFDAEVLVEGLVSNGVIEGKCRVEIGFFFSARVRKIKYLNKPEENKIDAANYLQTRRLRRTQY